MSLITSDFYCVVRIITIELTIKFVVYANVYATQELELKSSRLNN